MWPRLRRWRDRPAPAQTPLETGRLRMAWLAWPLLHGCLQCSQRQCFASSTGTPVLFKLFRESYQSCCSSNFSVGEKKKILQSLQYLLSITAVPLELYGAHDDSRATGCMRKSAGWHSRTRLHSSSSVCPFYTPRRNLLGKLVDPCTGMPAGRVQLILARSAGVPSNSSSPSTAQGFSTPRLNASHPPGSTVISHGLLG